MFARSPILAIVLCHLIAGTGCPAVVNAGEVTAGAAREWFTLPQGVPLAGYSRRHGEPSTGAHDPVGVRALVVADAQTTLALVACDLLIVDERLANTARSRLITEGLPPDMVLVVAATHTHSGPGGYGRKFLEKMSMGHFDPDVFEAIVHAIVRAVANANARRQPCRAAYGTARTEGLVVNRIDPSGPVDDELVVSAVFPQEANDPLAILVSFAAHPTTLGAWNRAVSADYPGVIARELERRFPEALCLFLAGSVADQAPKKAGEGFERAEWVGRTLAQQVIALLEHARPAPAHRVAAMQERMRLPPAKVRLGRVTLPRWLGSRLVDDDATLSLVSVGRTVFFGVPCDLAAALGQTLKESARSRGLQPVIVGFASDYIGYCVPAALYEAKKYESSMAFNGPHTGELIVNRLVHMLDTLVISDE